jgi:hypothetical protein
VPIISVIDRIRQRMTTYADGVVTFEEINRHLDNEERERGLELPELFDARGATTDITSTQVRQLIDRAQRALRQTPLGPTAIVATDNASFGLARMYATLAESLAVRVGVFRDVESAERWLTELDPHG